MEIKQAILIDTKGNLTQVDVAEDTTDFYYENNISNDKSVLFKGCKFYIPSACSINRDIIKKYCDAYDAKRVLDINKADIVLFDDSYFGELNEYKIYKNPDTSDTRDYISTKYRYTITYLGKTHYHTSLGKKHFYIVPDDYKDIITSGKIILYANVVIHELYKNSEHISIIDTEQYKVLQNMFVSNDIKDVELAVSIVENCNIDKSIIYVYFLLCDAVIKKKIIAYSFHKRSKFVTILNYLDCYLNKYDYLQLDDVFKTLERLNLLTKYNIDIYMKAVKANCIKHIKKTFDCDDIIVNLTITEELKNKIKNSEVNPKQLKLKFEND